MPTKNQFNKTLRQLIEDSEDRIHRTLKDKVPYWSNFEAWRTLCQDTIDLIYGVNSRNLSDFNIIRFSEAESDASLAQQNITFLVGLFTASQRLKGFLLTVESYLDDDIVQQSVTHPTVFLSHSGKSKKLADKLRMLLDSMGATVIDVMNEPNKFLPIDAKVETYMNSCNLGIVLITADDELKNGEIRERPNIDHEIGMMMKSNNIASRVILLKEDKVTKLPSNYQNKGHIEFNRGYFAEIYPDIIREIRSFNFL